MKMTNYEKIVSHWIPSVAFAVCVALDLIPVSIFKDPTYFLYKPFAYYLFTRNQIPFWLFLIIAFFAFICWVFMPAIIGQMVGGNSLLVRAFGAALFAIDSLLIVLYLCFGRFHAVCWYLSAALEGVLAFSQIESIRLYLKRENTPTAPPTEDGVQCFADRRAEFQTLQEALRGLPVTKIGKGLPAAAVKQEAAGWQICSRETLPDDTLAQLGDALKPLTGVLYGVSVQTPFTYFIVSPANIEGRVCVSYSPDGTEPTQFARDLRPIEPHWFALRFG